ncbi:MAG: hypothetical protein JJU11_17395 [Candidatus Sumerlaeia bacterium]|nr:hypothetical protein [Candidatus Sumerlaeia bacterium]
MSFFPRHSYLHTAGMGSSQPPSKAPPKDSESTIMELRSECARLHMQVQTLARLLIAKGVMEEAELDEWMSYVDSLDGVADGRLRVTRAPKMCPSCNRANGPTAASCQWCGHELPMPFLDPGKVGNEE